MIIILPICILSVVPQNENKFCEILSFNLNFNGERNKDCMGGGVKDIYNVIFCNLSSTSFVNFFRLYAFILSDEMHTETFYHNAKVQKKLISLSNKLRSLMLLHLILTFHFCWTFMFQNIMTRKLEEFRSYVIDQNNVQSSEVYDKDEAGLSTF